MAKVLAQTIEREKERVHTINPNRILRVPSSYFNALYDTKVP